MANNQESKEEKEIQPTTLSPKLEWGPWFLWILASVTAGGLVITYIFFEGYDLALGFSASLGGIIGGIVVGFMPWLAQKRQISKVGWWISTLIGTAFIIIALVIVSINYEWLLGIYIGFWIIPSVLGSSIIGLITRWICKRWLNSQARWWEWILGGILILIIGFIMSGFAVLTSMQ